MNRLYGMMWPGLRLLSTVVWGLRVYGAERVPREGGCILASNHQSYLDSMIVLMALPLAIRKRLSFAGAQDVIYKEYGSISWLLELLFASFPLPRKEGENIRSGLENMGGLLDHGRNIVVFPEGRMYRTGHIGPLKKGAGLVAVDMRVPIVPMKIIDPDKILPHESVIPKGRGKVIVRIGKPIQFSLKDSHIKATETIQRVIEAL